MEFFVCPQGHRLPEWWRGPCLHCNYPGGLEILREKVRQGEVYGDVRALKMSLQEIVPTDVPTCEDCGENPKEGRYKTCSACRKRAYRERSR